MLSIFGKKKISENNVANIVVNFIFKHTENGFPELIEIVENTPEFIVKPDIDPENIEDFLMIVLVGNLNFIPIYFNPDQEQRLRDKIIEKFAKATQLDVATLKTQIKTYKDFMVRVNHPSKNMIYAMSKSFFRKYGLNDCQEEFFRTQKVPNPMFQKRLDSVMTTYIFNWEQFIGKYKVV
ncbi:hypothetical protein [Luteibaculum oceani]|uniref:Uncharacterized protein n=1 Tax=Luteibaculum oceani TaxID=1294296 RepID=A0A5C6V8J5_9FLAO|nr:hypothetical protein [Luteibaculum oceani]TXC81703.1 hypothetical protein FRX97_04080 [Luteibaculum oceani]